MRRNCDFRHLTCNAGKGKKNGLRKLEIEEGDEIVTACNKDEIERRIIKHNKENFSKVKGTKAHVDKTHDATKEDDTRDNIMKGDLNREECDNEDVHQFLQLLKIPKSLFPDNEEKNQVNEWK